MGRRHRLALALAVALLVLPAVRGSEGSPAASTSLSGGLLDGLLDLPGELLGGLSDVTNRSGGSAAPAPGGYAAYATGTAVFAGAGGPLDLATVEIATASAAFRSDEGGGVVDEMGRSAAPALGDQGGYGRGAGLGVSTLGVVPLLGSVAEASSPPSSGRVRRDSGPLLLPPLVRASILRGEAEARSPQRGCVLGSDLAYGLGQATGVTLGGLGSAASVLSTTDSGGGALRSAARTSLVAGDGVFGLAGEVRQTLAPVTFLAGTPAEFTLEIGGEWVLRATADGTNAGVTFGAGDDAGPAPSAPLLRIKGPAGETLADLRAEDLAGGRQMLMLPGVAEVAVGEMPRPLPAPVGTASEPGTHAAAAVDVARVRLAGDVGEIRLGHMEVAVNVPADGIHCPPLEVTSRAEPAEVAPGGEAAFLVTVTNPNDGVLSDVGADVVLSPSPDLRFEVAGDGAAPTTGGAWEGLGPLGPGETATVRLGVRILPESASGRVAAQARARGVYGFGPGEPGTPAVEGGSASHLEVTRLAPVDTGPVDDTPPPPPSPPADDGVAAAASTRDPGGVVPGPTSPEPPVPPEPEVPPVSAPPEPEVPSDPSPTRSPAGDSGSAEQVGSPGGAERDPRSRSSSRWTWALLASGMALGVGWATARRVRHARTRS